MWSFALIWCIKFACGLALCQLLLGYLEDETVDIETRRLVFAYFGTFTKAILTMFEITLANWIVPCRLLSSQVNEWYGFFFIIYRGCIMFAVVKVITAVFVSETTRCQQNDDEIAMQKKKKATAIHYMKIAEVFKELDTSGDGHLNWEEFQPLIHDTVIKTWLQSMDIDTHDLTQLFDILDDGDAHIYLNEFVDGMGRIKGPAKSMDVLKLLAETKYLRNHLDTLIERDEQHRQETANTLRALTRSMHVGDRSPGRTRGVSTEASEAPAPSSRPASGEVAASKSLIPAGVTCQICGEKGHQAPQCELRQGPAVLSTGGVSDNDDFQDLLRWTEEDEAGLSVLLARNGRPKGLKKIPSPSLSPTTVVRVPPA